MSKLIRNTIVRRIKADCGHRVFGHEGKCASVHGHEYKFELHARAAELDSIGRVIDFSVLKGKVGSWVDQNWDHGMLLWATDPIAFYWQDDELRGHKVFFLPYNPTAENLARYLLGVANELMKDTGVEVFKVVCHETENCWAEAILDGV